MRDSIKLNRQTGFTLVEAMVVVGIIGVGAAFSYSGMEFVQRVKVESEVTDVATFLNRARAEGLRSGRRMVICAGKNTQGNATDDKDKKDKDSQDEAKEVWQCSVPLGSDAAKNAEKETWAEGGLIAYYADNVKDDKITEANKENLFLDYKKANFYDVLPYTGFVDGAGTTNPTAGGYFFHSIVSKMLGDYQDMTSAKNVNANPVRLVFDVDGSVFNFGRWPGSYDIMDSRSFELLLKRKTSKYDDLTEKSKNRVKTNNLSYRIVVEKSGRVSTCKTLNYKPTLGYGIPSVDLCSGISTTVAQGVLGNLF